MTGIREYSRLFKVAKNLSSDLNYGYNSNYIEVFGMPSYGIAEAKAQFSELIARANRGEEVVLARNGQSIGRLTRAEPPKRVSLAELRAHLARQPRQTIATAEIVREMRDERY